MTSLFTRDEMTWCSLAQSYENPGLTPADGNWTSCDVGYEQEGSVKRVVTKTGVEVTSQNRNFHKGCGELCNADKECQAFEVIYATKGDEDPTSCKLYRAPDDTNAATKYTKSATAGACGIWLPTPTNNQAGIIGQMCSLQSVDCTKNLVAECQASCEADATCTAYSYSTSTKQCQLYNEAKAMVGTDQRGTADEECFLKRKTDLQTPIGQKIDATETKMCMSRKKALLDSVIADVTDPVTKFKTALGTKLTGMTDVGKTISDAWVKNIGDTATAVTAGLATWNTGADYTANKAAYAKKMDQEIIENYHMLIDNTFNTASKAMKDMITNYKVEKNGLNGDSLNPFGKDFGVLYGAASVAEKAAVDKALLALYQAKNTSIYKDKLHQCMVACSKTTLPAAANSVMNAALKEKKKLFEKAYAIHSFNADRTAEIKYQDTLLTGLMTAVGGFGDGVAAGKGYIDITAYIKKRQDKMVEGLGKDVLALFIEHAAKLQSTEAVYTLKSSSDILQVNTDFAAAITTKSKAVMGQYAPPTAQSGELFSDCSQTGAEGEKKRNECKGSTLEKPICCAAFVKKPAAVDGKEVEADWELTNKVRMELCHESGVNVKELASPIFVQPKVVADVWILKCIEGASKVAASAGVFLSMYMMA